jgi:hypothetical protein
MTMEIPIFAQGAQVSQRRHMTAEDVAFAYSAERRESDGPSGFHSFSNIADNEIVDPLTVRIVMGLIHPGACNVEWRGRQQASLPLLGCRKLYGSDRTRLAQGLAVKPARDTDAFANLEAFDDHC